MAWVSERANQTNMRNNAQARRPNIYRCSYDSKIVLSSSMTATIASTSGSIGYSFGRIQSDTSTSCRQHASVSRAVMRASLLQAKS
jgi:hypothetical protein